MIEVHLPNPTGSRRRCIRKCGYAKGSKKRKVDWAGTIHERNQKGNYKPTKIENWEIFVPAACAAAMNTARHKMESRGTSQKEKNWAAIGVTNVGGLKITAANKTGKARAGGEESTKAPWSPKGEGDFSNLLGR